MVHPIDLTHLNQAPSERNEVIAMSDDENIFIRSSSETDFEYADFLNLIKETQEVSEEYTNSIGRGPLIESTLILFNMDGNQAPKVILITGDRRSGKTDLMLGTADRIAELKLNIRFFEWRILYYPQGGQSASELLEGTRQDFNLWLRSQTNRFHTIILLETPLPCGIQYNELFDMLQKTEFFARDIKLVITTIPTIHNPLLSLIEDVYRIPSAIIDLTNEENSRCDSSDLKKIALQQVEAFYTSEAIEEVVRATLEFREGKEGEEKHSTPIARPLLRSDIARLNTIIDSTNSYARLYSIRRATVQCVKKGIEALVRTGNLHAPRPEQPFSYLHMYS